MSSLEELNLLEVNSKILDFLESLEKIDTEISDSKAKELKELADLLRATAFVFSTAFRGLMRKYGDNFLEEFYAADEFPTTLYSNPLTQKEEDKFNERVRRTQKASFPVSYTTMAKGGEVRELVIETLSLIRSTKAAVINWMDHGIDPSVKGIPKEFQKRFIDLPDLSTKTITEYAKLILKLLKRQTPPLRGQIWGNWMEILQSCITDKVLKKYYNEISKIDKTNPVDGTTVDETWNKHKKAYLDIDEIIRVSSNKATYDFVYDKLRSIVKDPEPPLG